MFIIYDMISYIIINKNYNFDMIIVRRILYNDYVLLFSLIIFYKNICTYY